MSIPDPDAGDRPDASGSDAGRPGGGEPGRPDGPREPDGAELARIATPGTVRRAPRYRAFVAVGVLAGLLLAVPIVLLWPGPATELGRGPVVLFTGLTLAVVGGILGAAAAVLADRRSRRP